MNLPRCVARATVLALLVAALLPGAPAAADAARVPLCPVLSNEPGLGLVCQAENGLLASFSPAGAFQGYTHGVDDFGTESLATSATIKAPACVAGAAGEAYTRVIYARAFDAPDQHDALQDSIRALVATANGMVADAAAATGGVADLKVLCAAGLVVVANETLPTAKASATFSSIVADLRAKGYTSRDIKNWVYYDDAGACTCTGTGHLYSDDTLSSNNLNNGATGTTAMFAVDFGHTGATGARTLLHELGHTMGAVQNSAPHSSAAGHCWDGKDTMCYNDGGANATKCTPDFYCSSVCATEIFDCGKDDYFNRAPAAGSYLATHWNIGNTLNRFVSFGVPAMRSLSCPSVIGVTQTATCTFLADDDSSGVTYAIAWGDGATSCAPGCGTFAAPGIVQSASHTYASGGARNVTVSATDGGTPAQTSAALTQRIAVDATPPTSTIVLTGTRDAATGWYRSAVSASVTATDAGGSSVNASFASVDGDNFTTVPPARSIASDGVHAIRYYSRDAAANVETVRNATVSVDRTAPAGHLAVTCSPCVGAIGLNWDGADAGSHLRTARIAWTLSASSVTLVSGDVCAPTVSDLASSSGSCSFGGWMGVVPGTYCFALALEDRAGNPATTAPVCETLA